MICYFIDLWPRGCRPNDRKLQLPGKNKMEIFTKNAKSFGIETFIQFNLKPRYYKCIRFRTISPKLLIILTRSSWRVQRAYRFSSWLSMSGTIRARFADSSPRRLPNYRSRSIDPEFLTLSLNEFFTSLFTLHQKFFNNKVRQILMTSIIINREIL